MAVDAAIPRADAPARPFLLAVPATALLILVAASAAIRFLLALAHTTPLYFADEYIYSTLAHELATTGRPTIRGDAASFPALLEPLLTAPFWLPGDPELALRLTQGLNAVAMSLAAVPVYLLARKLGLSKPFGLAGAALALVCPDLFYVASILGEPIAYPLVLGAVYAGVCALDRPTRWNQIAFVALSALATFARVQFVVLPAAFVAAGLITRSLRRVRLALALFAVPAVALVVVGVGYYSGVKDFSLPAAEFARWIGTDAMLLAYAAGWVVVPGALVALVSALVRPRERAERAFAALTSFFAAGLFVEAGLYAANAKVGPGGRFQERYLFTLLPLLVLAFGLSLRHAGRARLAVAAIALALIGLSARIPLAGYTDSHNRQDSPFLIGLHRIEELIGTANASLAIAAAVAFLSLVAAAVAFRPRLGPLALVAAGLLLAATSAGAFSLDRRYAEQARATYLPPDARWVDHATDRPVTLVNTAGARREIALEQLFWNRSIRRLVLLRQAERVDAFASPRVRISGDGTLLLHGRALRDPLLLNRFAVDATFRDAVRSAHSLLFDLWQPSGSPAKLSMLVGGRYFDGLLATTGYVKLWPATAGGRLDGTLRLKLELPQTAPRGATLFFRSRTGTKAVAFRPGATRSVAFAVSGHGPWTLRWTSRGGVYLDDGRPVTVASAPFAVTSSGSSPGLRACDLREEARGESA